MTARVDLSMGAVQSNRVNPNDLDYCFVPQSPGAPIRALGYARIGSRGLNGPFHKELSALEINPITTSD